MDQCHRLCEIKGHDGYPTLHLCCLLECNQPTRWCCSECIQKGIHNHSKPNNSHIMKTKEILSKLQQELHKFEESLEQHKTRQLSFLKKLFSQCQELEYYLIKYRNLIDQQIQNITQGEYQEKLKEYINNIIVDNFVQLDDNNINQVIKTNLQQFIQNQQLLSFDNIRQQLTQIEAIIKKHQDFKIDNSNSNSNIEIKSRKYFIQEIDQCYSIIGSSISQNEQYIAFGGFDEQLKIYDIKLNRKIKEIKQKDYIKVCIFTQDSSQLYVGIQGGCVCGYNVKDDFKQIFHSYIHSNSVYNIITIQNQFLITCSHDNSIIKTNIKTKQQIYKLTGHTDYVMAIDYNQQDEIIASGSGDKSIIIWNCRTQSIIINKKKSHKEYIFQIQMINNYQNILSLDKGGNLYKWRIDFIKKELIKIQYQFIDEHKIISFYQSNNNQNLLLICKNYAKIVNQEGEALNTIEHQVKESSNYDCRQLDNLKYIQIRSDRRLMLAIAQD